MNYNAPTTTSVRDSIIFELGLACISIRNHDKQELRTTSGIDIRLISRPGNTWQPSDDRIRGIRVSAGGYGSGLNRSYPLRKDGTFNLEKIIETVRNFSAELKRIEADRKRREQLRDADEVAQREACTELAKLTGADGERMTTYGAPRCHSASVTDELRVAVEPGGGVYILSERLTLEQAKTLLEKIL